MGRGTAGNTVALPPLQYARVFPAIHRQLTSAAVMGRQSDLSRPCCPITRPRQRRRRRSRRAGSPVPRSRPWPRPDCTRRSSLGRTTASRCPGSDHPCSRPRWPRWVPPRASAAATRPVRLTRHAPVACPRPSALLTASLHCAGAPSFHQVELLGGSAPTSFTLSDADGMLVTGVSGAIPPAPPFDCSPFKCTCDGFGNYYGLGAWPPCHLGAIFTILADLKHFCVWQSGWSV